MLCAIVANFLSKILNSKRANELFDAITYERFEVVEKLLSSGLSANVVDEFGQTPLFRIVYNKTPTQVNFLRLFISHGAEVNFKRPDDGITPLFFAKGDALKVLLENGADLSARSNKGASPIHYASRLEDVKVLLEKGLDINDTNHNLSTPLHGYVYSDSSLLKFCIDNGAKLDAKDVTGWTPLMCLARTEYVTEKSELLEVITKAEYLIKAGADVTITDNDGMTAYDHAILVDSHDFAKWLKDISDGKQHTT